MSTIEVINVEHKSTSADILPGSDYWKALHLDTQISSYQTGTRALGYEPVGTLYDVTKKITTKPYLATPLDQREYTKEKSRLCKECRKKNPTPAPHFETVQNDLEPPHEVACVDGRIITDAGGKLYANMRERDETPDEYRERVRADIIAAPEKYYQRGTIVRLRQEEVDAARDTWELAKQIRESQLENRWPRNPDACRSYNSYCPYWVVCTGQATIDDPTKFRDAPVTVATAEDGKKRLPILSVTSMQRYRACNRRYYFANELRRRSIEDTDAQNFGKVWHVGLETWWQTVDIQAAITAMRETYAKHSISWVDAVRAEELLRGYDARWRNEPLKVLNVEVEFRAPLVNPKTGAKSATWELGGRIDAIIAAPDQARAA